MEPREITPIGGSSRIFGGKSILAPAKCRLLEHRNDPLAENPGQLVLRHLHRARHGNGEAPVLIQQPFYTDKRYADHLAVGTEAHAVPLWRQQSISSDVGCASG